MACAIQCSIQMLPGVRIRIRAKNKEGNILGLYLALFPLRNVIVREIRNVRFSRLIVLSQHLSESRCAILGVDSGCSLVRESRF